MTQYRMEVYSDTYPTTFDVEATNEGMAFKEAYKLWRTKFKGRRLKVNAIKVLSRTEA